MAGAADWSNVDPDYLHDSIADKLTYLNDFERSEVYAAIEIAFHAHDGQRRKSGEPFVTHPVAVAGILADQHMDHETVIAGLLHDTVEDTDAVTFESIEDRFGPAVRRIVEGETKVSKVSSSVSKQGAELTPDAAKAAAANVQADDLQQMFLAMTTEVRVIIVKLADRLHNMRTLGALKPEKRVKISRETLLVFAPLAKLLGMYEVKNELEELAFRWSAPERPRRDGAVVRRAQRATGARHPQSHLELRRRLEEDEYLRAVCAKVDVTPRAKELYGLYRKAGGEKLGAIERIVVPAGSSSSSPRTGAGKNGDGGAGGRRAPRVRLLASTGERGGTASAWCCACATTRTWRMVGCTRFRLGVLSRPGRGARHVAARPRSDERLRRHPQAQRLPRAAHGGASDRERPGSPGPEGQAAWRRTKCSRSSFRSEPSRCIAWPSTASPRTPR